jgi:LemA protein
MEIRKNAGFVKWVVVIAIILVVVAWTTSKYNSFVALNQKVDTQWAQVENQFQRRFDLVPNLVNIVKGITKQELEVFTAIAEARTRYSGAQTTDAKVAAANEYQSALGRLLVIVENYPQLKSSDSFNALMAEYAGTENRVAVERGRFNEVVGDYNVATKRIPGSLVAMIFGFDQKELFKAQDGAETAPVVNFE